MILPLDWKSSPAAEILRVIGTLRGNGFLKSRRHPRRLNSLTVAEALELSAVISAVAANEYLGERRRSFSTMCLPVAVAADGTTNSRNLATKTMSGTGRGACGQSQNLPGGHSGYQFVYSANYVGFSPRYAKALAPRHTCLTGVR